MSFGSGPFGQGHVPSDQPFGTGNNPPQNPFIPSGQQYGPSGQQYGQPFSQQHGQPFSQQQMPVPPRRRRMAPVLIIASIAVALIVMGVGAIVFLGHRTSTQAAQPGEPVPPVPSVDDPAAPRASAPPSSTPTPTPTPSPTPENPNFRRDPLEPIPTGDVLPGREVLTDNPLYELPVDNHPCDVELKPFSNDHDSELERLTPVFDCAETIHASALEQVGEPEPHGPVFDLYADPHSTECGETQEVWTGVYCSSERSVRLDIAWAASLGDDYLPAYGYGYMIIFHEYAHHVQNRVGIFMAYNTEPYGSTEESIRRGELQTECIAAIGMARAGYVDDEWRDAYRRAGENSENDSTTHGSAKNKAYWTHRGWNAETYGDCNTWIAPSELVA